MVNKDHLNIDELAENIRQGSLISFKLLYRHMSGRVVHYAYSFLLSREEAEEVMQDVFLRIWDKRHTLTKDKSLTSFIFTITKNLTIDRIRKYNLESDKLKEYFREGTAYAQNSTEQNYLDQELRTIVEEIVQTMPTRRQMVYQLSRKKGMTNREISEYLQITPIAVEKHIRLALETLRVELDKKKWPLTIIVLLAMLFK